MLEYKNDKWKALLALAPTLLLMIVFTFYPIVNTVILAFMRGYTFGVWYDTPAADGWIQHFGETINGTYIGIGIGNFFTVFKDNTFQDALLNTSIMVLVSVPLSVIIALLISVALNSIKRFQALLQTIYFLPYVTNTIALGLVFSVLFSARSGLINSALMSIGLDPVPWTSSIMGQNPTYLTCLFVLTVYTIWNGLAFKILVFLSGMQSIDKQYYQAAQVDATPRRRVFTKITVPLLSPMIAYITITSFIGAFKAYSSVIAIFNGRFGPLTQPNLLITLVGYTYQKLELRSVQGELSKASASALILFGIIMLITLVQLQVSKKRVHY